MPANHKVSVAWQIVFSFIPIVDLWSFYRIRKLRKFVLFIILPYAVTTIIALILIAPAYYEAKLVDPNLRFSRLNWQTANPGLYIVITTISWGLQALAIYLVIIWSREHNRAFEMPSA